MKRKNKKHILLPAALLIYMVGMAILAYPKYREQGNWNEYLLVVGIGLLLPILLFFVLKRRKRIRDKFTNMD